MQPVAVNQAQESIQESIGLAVFQDRDKLIAMLRKNGASIDENISDDNLIKVTYLAVAKSSGFKKDFSDYLVGQFTEEQVGYVDDTDFFNVNAEKKAARATKKTARTTARKEAGGSKVGLALKKVGTEENISALVNTGLGVLANKLTAKADKESIQAATELASKKSQQALAEAQLQEQKAKSKKWVIPVVIGGLVVIGAIVYFVTRKKK